MKIEGNLKGILSMCVAMALFVLNDMFVKLAATIWPVHQIMMIRGFMATAVVLSLVFWAGEHRFWGEMRKPLLLLRGTVEGMVALSFITALTVMKLADITAILMISPLLITIAGAIFFGETIRWRRWMAVGIGFAGMLLVVRPTGEDFGPMTMLAILSAIGVAGRDLLTRAMPSSIPSLLVALSSTIATALIGLAISCVQPLVAYDGVAMLYSVLAAVTVGLGNYAAVLAFRDVEVSVVAPFRYSVIIWAVIGGYLVFGDGPAPIAWLGILLIVGSGLYTMYRERIMRGQA
jgi:drug/metabolite transporter (DMT)-like permease